MSIKVKICGVTMPEQAREIVGLGADYIGCIIEFPKSPRNVSAERAREIREAVEIACHSGAKRSEAIESQEACPSSVGSHRSLVALTPSRMTTKVVGVVVDLPFNRLSELIEGTGIRIWQLHGDEDIEYMRKVKELGVEVWKVTHGATVRHSGAKRSGAIESHEVRSLPAGSYRSSTVVSSLQDDIGIVDKIVVDAKDPLHGAGGSGKLSDWGFAKQLIDEGYDVVLSGGLNPENVQKGITYSRPRVVDASSGVEARPGVKDIGKVERFIKNVVSLSSRIGIRDPDSKKQTEKSTS